jgi:carbon storage regulator
MLVLTRRIAEKLYIGPDICITIVRVEGSQVRLGIEAPREISVLRAELVAADGPEPLPLPSRRRTGAERPALKNPRIAIPEIGSRRRGPSR